MNLLNICFKKRQLFENESEILKFKFLAKTFSKIEIKFVTLHSQKTQVFSGPIAQLVRVEDS